MPTSIPVSQTIQLQKGSKANLGNVLSGGHHENWGESNMADSSSRTDTSTDGDGDGDDKIQRVIFSSQSSC